MEKYIGTKIVLAMPMEAHAFQFGLGRSPGVTPEVDNQGHSQPGYKIQYEDGYISWSPQEVFERSYRKVTESEILLLEKGAVPGPPNERKIVRG